MVDSWESEQLPLAVRWPDQPPTLQPQAARVIDAQSWTTLFRDGAGESMMLRAGNLLRFVPIGREVCPAGEYLWLDMLWAANES